MKKHFFLTVMLLVISAIGFYAKAETTITWTDCSTYMGCSKLTVLARRTSDSLPT